MEVILASHAHQVPHVGRPQIDPVTRAIILNNNPEGARLFAINEIFSGRKGSSYFKPSN